MWERPHCPFCAMISVLRSAFLFSSLSQIPTSFYFLLFVSPLYNPSLFTCDRSPLPFPTSGLYGESQRLCLLAVGQTSVRNWPIRSFLRPRPQHLRMSVPCAQTFLAGMCTRRWAGWKKDCLERHAKREVQGKTELEPQRPTYFSRFLSPSSELLGPPSGVCQVQGMLLPELQHTLFALRLSSAQPVDLKKWAWTLMFTRWCLLPSLALVHFGPGQMAQAGWCNNPSFFLGQEAAPDPVPLGL